MERFTTSLHTHVRSLYDADIDAQALCSRIKELGGKGCAITDHGVLSSIEDYRRVFDANELKLIPGVELYVDGGILGRLHLVVLAKNDHGYKGISKMVTESNKTLDGDFPVISQDALFSIMKEYKGDVFALSACMQGVISAIFLLNNVVQKKMDKIRDKQSKYIAPMSEREIEGETEFEKAGLELDRLTLLRDETKAKAEAKFVQREKAVEKLEKACDPSAADARAELESDKIASEEAKANLDGIKKEVEAAKKRLSKAKSELKDINESIEKYVALDDEMAELKKELKSDEELMALAKKTAEAYVSAFGKQHFLAEIQYHGIPEEAVCFPKVVEVAKEMGLPVVATNDVHILNNTPEERLKRQLLRSLRFGETFEEENVGDGELYLKDNYELKDALVKILPEDLVENAIKNIDVVFNACNVEFVTGKHYPKFK